MNAMAFIFFFLRHKINYAFFFFYVTRPIFHEIMLTGIIDDF